MWLKVLQEYCTATVRGLQSRHAVSQYEFRYSFGTAILDSLPNIRSEFGIRLFFGDEPCQCQSKSLTQDRILGIVGAFENLGDDGVPDIYDRASLIFLIT